jgi:hypothetical protein
MSLISWEEYLNIPAATDEDIQRVEAQINIKFPEEFKETLKLAQGKTPIPNIIESEEVCEVPFGPILHVLMKVNPPSYAAYSIESVKEHWDEYYPDFLPIADSGDGCFFAYDFSKDKENPPVVFVNAEVDPEDDENDERLLFVANSLTELLSNLKD